MSQLVVEESEHKVRTIQKMLCPTCNSMVAIAVDRCTTCGANVGFPNVREALETQQMSVLDARYQRALDDASTRMCSSQLAEFEAAVQKSCAVINVDLRDLHFFFTNKNFIYSTYQLAVKGQVRKSAEEINDRQRLAIEGLIFGSYGERIRYAALSLDGSGLNSYGPYSIKLREVAISSRSSLLEENSYAFVERHNIRPGGPVPEGYTAAWKDRSKLSLAKLGSRIATTTKDSEYASILLCNGATRASDDYIEIHIYGPFDQNSIESVSGSSSTKNASDAALLAAIKERLLLLGKGWIEK